MFRQKYAGKPAWQELSPRMVAAWLCPPSRSRGIGNPVSLQRGWAYIILTLVRGLLQKAGCTVVRIPGGSSLQSAQHQVRVGETAVPRACGRRPLPGRARTTARRREASAGVQGPPTPRPRAARSRLTSRESRANSAAPGSPRSGPRVHMTTGVYNIHMHHVSIQMYDRRPITL